MVVSAGKIGVQMVVEPNVLKEVTKAEILDIIK